MHLWKVLCVLQLYDEYDGVLAEMLGAGLLGTEENSSQSCTGAIDHGSRRTRSRRGTRRTRTSSSRRRTTSPSTVPLNASPLDSSSWATGYRL